jgi:hypothetical protein
MTYCVIKNGEESSLLTYYPLLVFLCCVINRTPAAASYLQSSSNMNAIKPLFLKLLCRGKPQTCSFAVPLTDFSVNAVVSF